MVILPPSPSMWPVNPFESETPDLNVFVHSQNKKKTNGFIVPKSKHQGCHLPFLKSQATNGIGRIVNISVFIVTKYEKTFYYFKPFWGYSRHFYFTFCVFHFFKNFVIFQISYGQIWPFCNVFSTLANIEVGGRENSKKGIGPSLKRADEAIRMRTNFYYVCRKGLISRLYFETFFASRNNDNLK